MSDGFDISNNIISGKVDDVTMTFSDTGDFIVKDGGIGATQLEDASIATTKLASPTGTDTNVVTGTASATTDNLVKWDGNGDAVDAGENIAEIKDAAETYADTAATTAAEATAMQYSGVKVFEGALPTATTPYTTLDLFAGGTGGTGAIPQARCLVHLSVETDVTTNLGFRVGGESKQIGVSASAFGAGTSGAGCNAGRIIYLTVVTDSAGTVEWFSNSAGSGGTIVKVLAYQVLQS